MEIRELKSFCVVARLGSISLAAKELGLVQPTVSNHIIRLEKDLGTTLFDRVKRPIQLTPAGTKLAAITSHLVEGFESLKNSMDMEFQDGLVTVASVIDAFAHPLGPVIDEFRELYPLSKLNLRSGNREAVFNMVSRGEVDLGVVAGQIEAPDLRFEPLFAFDRILITPVDHPILEAPLESLDELAQWPLIVVRREAYTWTTLEAHFRRKGLEYRVVLEVDSTELAKRYVAKGLGMTVGVRFSIDEADRKILGIRSLAHLLKSDVAGIITLKRKSLSIPARNFLSITMKILGGTNKTKS